MTTTQNLSIQQFHLPEKMASCLREDGSLLVPEGYSDFVIYGPYLSYSAGYYVVRPLISADAQAGELGWLEICDNGRLLADTPLTSGSVLSVALPAVAGLEIRIRASGTAFELRGVMFVHKPEVASQMDEKSVFAQVGKAESWLRALREERGAAFESVNRDMLTVEVPMASFETLETALHEGASPARHAFLAEGLDFGEPFQVWLKRKAAPKIVDIWGAHLVPKAASLAEDGFSIPALRLMTTDAPELAAFMAHNQGHHSVAEKLLDEPDCEYDLSDGVPLMDELRRVQGGFMKAAAMTGKASCLCPFTGQLLTTSYCLPVPYDEAKQVFLFYRFESVTTFYLVVAGFSGSRMLLYCPARDLLLRLTPPIFEWGQIEACIGRFREILLPRAEQVASYLSRPTRPAVLAGTMNNLGHFFWNEVAGIYEFERKGYLNNIQDGVLYRYGFIDPFDLWPGRLRVQKPQTAEALCDAVLEHGLFCVRPCESKITDELAGKLAMLALQKGSEAQKAALAEAKRTDFVLWAALRAHNKVWVNQVEGILAVADHLSTIFPQSALYIDGTSDCRELYLQIVAKAPKNVRIYDGTNVPFTDTLLWSFGIDAYIATIGSGLVSVTWLAAKPGIAHSETHHLHQMSFWGDVRQDAPAPLVPRIEEVRDLGEAGYCDYEIEPKTILRLVHELLDGCLSTRAGP